MLTPSKFSKFSAALKSYKKKYLDKNLTELDESGTRLMINFFLHDVLGYQPIEEIKTEYMIKGTYADYVIQVNSIRYFLVEVKALSFQLSDKHLRQTINYGANEGIEWAVLTNGKNFDFYRILFNQPIEARKMFSFDLSDTNQFKEAAQQLKYLHRDSVVKGGLKAIWNKCEAVDPLNVAGIIYSQKIKAEIVKLIKSKYGEKCSEEDLMKSLNKIVFDKIDPASIKPYKTNKTEKKKRVKSKEVDTSSETETQILEMKSDESAE